MCTKKSITLQRFLLPLIFTQSYFHHKIYGITLFPFTFLIPNLVLLLLLLFIYLLNKLFELSICVLNLLLFQYFNEENKKRGRK